ncbi:DUF3237 domain-containing protein [Cohnella sp. AR92]|uniref:DUF3237 domain-containing protein n=1 Tax=Cohnella sp. AR92 TaxID=648716 RepID=UPI000F8D5549|nr:DUF3237 domain-containing protein [Cohnella sp. AR92]RUS48883.1 DUF3237 domain-containing protein [Cohnella sp. AR92]
MIHSELAFEAVMEVGPVQELGATPKGARKMIPILGGRFSGPKIEGIILPGGADWQLIRNDGVAEVKALYTMKTADGTMIYIVNRGYRHGPKEVMSRLAAGEPVSPEDYYFRTTPVFEVEDGRYGWLNRTLMVGIGERTKESVRIRFYEIL